MSVLINGMKMPYGCADCSFCGGLILPDGIYCCDCPAEASHGKNISDAINDDTRAEFCPLVEVKEPHGKLIDVSKLNMYDVSPVSGFCVIGVTEEDIELADAVIEAEGR